MVGWLANVLVLYGSYAVGNRWRVGFLCQLAGNGAWAGIGLCRYEGADRMSLIVLSLAFCVLYAINFYK